MSPSRQVDIWQIEWLLYIRFACTYLKEYNAIPDTIEHGFMTTIYGGDLKTWSLKHMRELTTRATKLRNKRELDASIVEKVTSLPGYMQLVELMKG